MLADAFPSSVAFDAISESLKSDDAERKNAIKQGKGVFAFTLKNKSGETDSWYIDLKETGTVGKGLGTKPNGETIRATNTDTENPALTARHSHPSALGRGLWKPGGRQGQRPEALHVGQAQG